MKVGLVLAAPPGYSETFFRNKIKGLQENGVEVILFVNAFTGKLNQLPCKVIRAPEFNKKNPVRNVYTGLVQIGKAILTNPIKSYRLYYTERQSGKRWTQCLKSVIINQFLLQEQVDWLHFGFGTMAINRENVAAAIGAKMAVSFRGFDIGIYPIKHRGCYTLLFQRVNKIHVISDDLRELLYKQGLSEEVPIVKITPAIDSEFFQPVSNPLLNPKLKILTISRLHWKKGLEHTLKALTSLKEMGIDFDYTIIGDGSERERLVFSAYQFGIADQVSFLGKLSPAEVKHHLEQTDLYIQYSIQEGFCNAVLEAQAMGLLCIVSDAEGLSENVVHGTTGWVVPKRNPTMLAERLQRVITLPEHEKHNIRQNAVKRVKEQFNLEKQKQEFLRFYNTTKV